MEPRTELPLKNPSLVQQPPAILVDTQGKAMLPPIAAFVEPPTKRKHQPSKHNEEANSIGNKAGRSKKHPAAASSANSGPSKYMVDPMPLAITIRLIRKNKIK
jgi:histone deacetylase complex regulatory component SIN3